MKKKLICPDCKKELEILWFAVPEKDGNYSLNKIYRCLCYIGREIKVDEICSESVKGYYQSVSPMEIRNGVHKQA